MNDFFASNTKIRHRIAIQLRSGFSNEIEFAKYSSSGRASHALRPISQVSAGDKLEYSYGLNNDYDTELFPKYEKKKFFEF